MKKLPEYFAFASLFLVLFAICRIIDFNGLYGQDAHEYLRYSHALQMWMLNGTKPGDYFWPVNYPLYGAMFSFLTGSIISLQVVSIAAFTGSTWFIYKSINILHDGKKKHIAIYILLFFVLSPYMLRFSVLAMSDMLSVFFVSGVYFSYLLLSKTKDGNYLVLMMFFAASAIMTRYATFVVILPALIHSIILMFKRRNIIYFALAGMISVICFLPHFLLRGNNTLNFLSHPWITEWNPLNFFKHDFINEDGHQSYPVINIIQIFSNILWPTFLSCGIILVSFFRKSDFKGNSNKIILSAIILYALFLAGIPFQNMRFLLLSFPLVILLLFPAFERALATIKKKSFRYGILTCIAMAQTIMCWKAFQFVYIQNSLEKNIAGYFTSTESSPIYTLGMEGALTTYHPGLPVISLYGKLLRDVQHPAYILIEEKELIDQYHDKEPALNWQFIIQKYPANHIKSFPHGWELYEIR